MLKHKELMETQYKTFITEAVQNGVVWMLEDGETVGISTSNEFFDEDGDEAGVVLFWSKEGEAKQVAIAEWSEYKAVAVDLDVFLEFSVVTISNEDMLMGINWGTDMSGKEIHPIEIALDIIKELEATGKPVALKHHADLSAYKEVTQSVADEIFGTDNQ